MATTINLAVTSGTDDGSYSSTGGNSGFTFGAGIYSGMSTYVFIRFLNVAIPQGAKITSATLVLEVQNAYGTKWGTLKGIDLDTCPARGVSRASLPYTDAATPITYSNYRSTLNVTAIVQEIVSRPGWASGGALGLLGDPTGSDDEIYFFGFEDGYAPKLTVTYEDSDPAPGDTTPPIITSTANPSVNENTVNPTGSLTANESVTWTKVGGADQALFSLAGSTWTLNATPDYETKTSYTVVWRATDAAGNWSEQTMTLKINDLADTDITPPTITSASSVSFEENTVNPTGSLTANEAVTWTIAGGADAAFFTLSGPTWTLNATPDFEAKTSYTVVFRATDAAGNWSQQTFTVNITDVDETVPGDPGGGSSGTWTPSELASNKFWFKADELTGANGASIPALIDASGNGNTTTSTGAGLATVAAGHKNGLNTAYFNGTNNWYGLPEGFLNGWPSGSGIYLMKRDQSPPTATTASGVWGDFGSVVQRSLIPWVDGLIHDNYLSSGQFSNIPIPGAGTNAEKAKVYAYDYNIITNIVSPTEWSLYFNGVLIYSYTALNRFSPNTTGTGTGVPKIGATIRTGPVFLKGHIAEASSLNAAMTEEERQKFEGYLAHKWGVAANLPADHPYKSEPPAGSSPPAPARKPPRSSNIQ